MNHYILYYNIAHEHTTTTTKYNKNTTIYNNIRDDDYYILLLMFIILFFLHYTHIIDHRSFFFRCTVASRILLYIQSPTNTAVALRLTTTRLH